MQFPASRHTADRHQIKILHDTYNSRNDSRIYLFRSKLTCKYSVEDRFANSGIQPPDQALNELFIREAACDPTGFVRSHVTSTKKLMTVDYSLSLGNKSHESVSSCVANLGSLTHMLQELFTTTLHDVGLQVVSKLTVQDLPQSRQITSQS
jgi:hypothetical protein